MPKKRTINDINKRTAQQFVPLQNQTAGDFSRNAQAYHAAANKKSKGKKALIVVLCSILAVLLFAGTAFALYVMDVSNKLNKGGKSDDELMAINEALNYKSNFNEVFYMLLVGTDARPDEGEMCRSDVNIVARIDPINNEVSLLSIPRDTKITIEGHGTQKFNAAYAFDKIPGVIKATEELLDVPISHYAEVNFTDLKELVNAVGGITVDVEGKIDDEHCDDGDGQHYVLEPGVQKLNGGQALTYARSRYSFARGDFARSDHQRQVIEGIVNEVTSAPITDIPTIVQAAANCVTTDIGIIDIIGLAQQFADADEIVMHNAMVPSYTQNINGISFVVTDDAKLKEMLELFKEGKECGEVVSNKVAPDITDKSIDTSNTLLLDSDDEVISGKKQANTNLNGTGSSSGATTGNKPSGGSSTGGSTGSSEGGTGGSTGGSTGSDTGGSTDSGSSGNAGGNTGGDGGNTGSTDSGSSGTTPAEPSANSL